jgi:hypothetical protein
MPTPEDADGVRGAMGRGVSIAGVPDTTGVPVVPGAACGTVGGLDGSPPSRPVGVPVRVEACTRLAFNFSNQGLLPPGVRALPLRCLRVSHGSSPGPGGGTAGEGRGVLLTIDTC